MILVDVTQYTEREDTFPWFTYKKTEPTSFSSGAKSFMTRRCCSDSVSVSSRSTARLISAWDIFKCPSRIAVSPGKKKQHGQSPTVAMNITDTGYQSIQWTSAMAKKKFTSFLMARRLRPSTYSVPSYM